VERLGKVAMVAMAEGADDEADADDLVSRVTHLSRLWLR